MKVRGTGTLSDLSVECRLIAAESLNNMQKMRIKYNTKTIYIYTHTHLHTVHMMYWLYIYHSPKISSHFLISCSTLWQKFLSQVDCLVEVRGKVQVVPILNSSPGAIWVQFHACLTMALDIGMGQCLVLVAYLRYPKNRRLGAPWRQSSPFTCWIWNLSSSVMYPAV